jgi:uncharacterized membrane-anchored protein
MHQVRYGVIGAILIALLFGVAMVNLYAFIFNLRPTGEQVRSWAYKYPGYAWAIAFLFGMLLAHLFWLK